MSKRDYSQEMNKIAEEFNKPIVDELRQSIQNICKYYQLSIQDLCKLCDIDSTIMEELINGDSDNDCLYDLRTITLLTLLSNGKLNILNDTPSGKAFNDVNCIIKDYQDENNQITKPVGGWDDKIKQMLELFGVKNLNDMDHLLNAVKSVRNVINEYDLTDGKKADECCNGNCNRQTETKNENKRSPIYVDEKGNFHSQEPYTSYGKSTDTPRYDENEKKSTFENKLKGLIYDSKTMDKPKEFEFTGNLDKIIPNILDFVTKKLF